MNSDVKCKLDTTNHKVIGTTGSVHLFDVTNMVENPSTTTNYSKLSISCINLDDTIDLTTGKLFQIRCFDQ